MTDERGEFRFDEHAGDVFGLLLDPEADAVRVELVDLVHVQAGHGAVRPHPAWDEEDERAAARLGIVVASPALTGLLRRAAKAAARADPVLIDGETGAGKDVVARWVHARGSRARGPFVAVNCSHFLGTLVDSQLLGHAAGAFTGATGKHRGLLRSAAGGTLFLDELGEMPLDLQSKLLRFLDGGDVYPVGGDVPYRPDVRFVAATNSDLARRAASGRFRQDLLALLAAVHLTVPPLRARSDDIIALAQHFLREAVADACPIEPRTLGDDVRLALLRHPWPGHVPELRSVIRNAVFEGSCPDLADVVRVLGGSGCEPHALERVLGRPPSEIEAQILAALGECSATSIARLAQHLDRNADVVRCAVHHLRERGVLGMVNRGCASRVFLQPPDLAPAPPRGPTPVRRGGQGGQAAESRSNPD